MKFGKFTVDVIDTGLFGLDGGSMFGVVPKPLWSKAYNEGDDKNRIPLAARPMLIRFDDKVILVDTGNGTKYNEKFVSIFNINLEKSNFENNLKPLCISREDITDVILTHLHFDHAGGATMMEGNEAVATFPNARYYVQKEHLDWARKPTEKDRASFIPHDFDPIANAGLLELIEGDVELFSGINVIPVFGHTHAMQLVKLDSEGDVLLYCADLSPTSAHIKIPYVMGYDNFPLTTIEEKKKLFPMAANEGWTLVFEHDAFTQAAKIESGHKGIQLKEKITITDFS